MGWPGWRHIMSTESCIEAFTSIMITCTNALAVAVSWMGKGRRSKNKDLCKKWRYIALSNPVNFPSVRHLKHHPLSEPSRLPWLCAMVNPTRQRHFFCCWLKHNNSAQPNLIENEESNMTESPERRPPPTLNTIQGKVKPRFSGDTVTVK
jgi:hypothetical protein